jgi:hypothetical protein
MEPGIANICESVGVIHKCRRIQHNHKQNKCEHITYEDSRIGGFFVTRFAAYSSVLAGVALEFNRQGPRLTPVKPGGRFHPLVASVAKLEPSGII